MKWVLGIIALLIVGTSIYGTNQLKRLTRLYGLKMKMGFLMIINDFREFEDAERTSNDPELLADLKRFKVIRIVSKLLLILFVVIFISMMIMNK